MFDEDPEYRRDFLKQEKSIEEYFEGQLELHREYLDNQPANAAFSNLFITDEYRDFAILTMKKLGVTDEFGFYKPGIIKNWVVGFVKALQEENCIRRISVEDTCRIICDRIKQTYPKNGHFREGYKSNICKSDTIIYIGEYKRQMEQENAD